MECEIQTSFIPTHQFSVDAVRHQTSPINGHVMFEKFESVIETRGIE